MSKDEFCGRFIAEMLRIAGPAFGDGSSIAEYADEAAEAYFEDDFDMSPEECASTDISYWED